MKTVSYAQNYEDVMLLRALRAVEKGFYIDVGAQDPVVDSVTKAFYELGWHGINLEPVTHWYERLVADRPLDINLQLAVSDKPGRLPFYEVEASGLSTTDAEFARRHIKAGHHVSELDIQCVTLDSICDEHNVTTVHFLKIDCEGAEEAALRGLSLQRVRPWIILLEASEPNTQTPAYAEWEPLLTERGYRFVYADGLNRFYVADERADLLSAFTFPPNVFDKFVPALEVAANQREAAAHQREVAANQRADKLARELAIATDTQRKLQRELNVSAEVVRTRDKELVILDTENERREAALVGLRQHASALDEELIKLHAELNKVYRSNSWRMTAPLRGIGIGLGRILGRIYALIRRAAYIVLRGPMRLVRPILVKMATWTSLRWLIVHALGRDSWLMSRARIFLFGAPPLLEAPISSEASLTRQAARILSVIDLVRRQRQLDNTMQSPGRE